MARRDDPHADTTNGASVASLEVYERALRRILWTLREYLPDIIIIGGWVPHLYRRYGGFATWNGRLSLTAEVDVLVPAMLGTESRPPIAELLAAEGFTPRGGSVPAAVWTSAPERGERVEFLVSHSGTRRDVGDARVLPRQRELSAISLPELAIMERFTRKLDVPITTDRGDTRLRIRVPLLAAYVVNKAITFPKRQRLAGDFRNPKRAKDVLYLRDLMAAGQEVQDDIRVGLRTIAAGRGARLSLSTARNNLDGMLRGALRPVIAEVADALVLRDNMESVEAARADVEGHLTDLSEDIAEVLD
jgi:hypothetical protein